MKKPKKKAKKRMTKRRRTALEMARVEFHAQVEEVFGAISAERARLRAQIDCLAGFVSSLLVESGQPLWAMDSHLLYGIEIGSPTVDDLAIDTLRFRVAERMRAAARARGAT